MNLIIGGKYPAVLINQFTLTYLLTMYKNDILKYICDNLVAKLTDEVIDGLVKLLPELPPTIELKYVGKLSGTHSPCLHNVTRGITDRLPIKKSIDGKIVSFVCKTNKDARDVVFNINSKLSDYGYDAQYDDNFVTVKTSDYTSVSTMLAEIGLVVLFCLHQNNIEEFYFGVPSNVKSFDLQKEIQKRKEVAKEKFGIELKIPDKMDMERCKISIPVSDIIDPKFIEFIITNKPKPQQLRTYMCLYQLVQNNIPIQHIDKWDLLTIVHRHTGVKRSTLIHQLIENTNPLQKRIMEIFQFSKPNISITPNKMIRENKFFEELEYHIHSFKESAENEQV